MAPEPEGFADAAELRTFMDAAYATVHSCDLCGGPCCDLFTEPSGDMRPCKFDTDGGLWVCDLCQQSAIEGL